MTEKYLIIGYGGIGEAIVKHIQDNTNDNVAVVTRRPQPENSSVPFMRFDDLDAYLQNEIPDSIINTIGMLHDDNHRPEKNIKQLTEENLQTAIHINVMYTVKIAQSLAKHMPRSSKTKCLAFSARVSSISDNQLGGWYSYRASKAALNMMIKNISIEWARQFPNAAIYAYHPGTVDTQLSEPFQAHVSPDHLFSREKAARDCLTVLKQLSTQQSGGFYDYDGNEIPW